LDRCDSNRRPLAGSKGVRRADSGLVQPITLKAAAQLLGKSANTLDNWRAKGIMPAPGEIGRRQGTVLATRLDGLGRRPLTDSERILLPVDQSSSSWWCS
jgi:hypothetical protein